MLELLQTHTWLLLAGVFLLRITDQTLGVLRTISVVRGFFLLAAVMGFLEVYIWINVAAQVIQNLREWYLTLVYAAGFASGQAVGMWVEKKLALGNQLVRVISRRETDLAEKLWQKDYKATTVESMGRSGPVDVIFVVEGRENIPALIELICELDPECFYTVEDVRKVSARHYRPAGLLDVFPFLRWQNIMKKK